MSTVLSLLVVLLVLVAIAAPIILWIIALISVANNAFASPINKTIWILIILAFPIVGAIVWFVLSPSLFGPNVSA